MARKTKAEQAAYQAALKAAEVEQYPTLLLDTFERATKLGYELTVNSAKFVVRDLNTGSLWEMTPLYTEDSQWELDELVWAVDQEELRRMAEEARAQAKMTALSKLTKEERELLGL
jgi:hypothetical protein